jgi:hypothetical protein
LASGHAIVSNADFHWTALYDGAMASKTDDKTLTFHKVREINGSLKE